jgi:uncharacterized protein YkwD
MKKLLLWMVFLPILALAGSLLVPGEAAARRRLELITTPSQMIAAVNNLRISHGLPALTDHPILMQTAQSQADYMAATGNVTHARPGGMTYTQQLLSLGFPLAGDLSRGGFRAENILSSYGPLDWNGVPPGWQDADHMNTMLSQNFTHIGAGISQSGNTYYYAVDTAAVTSNGQMQSSAGGILTSVPGGADEAADVSQYMVPVTVSTARPDGDVIHKVQYGQSLWSIAIAYGTTIKNIQALNHLGEDLVIYQGQELLVLKGATQPAAQESATAPPVTETPSPTASTTAAPAETQAEAKPQPTDADLAGAAPVSSRALVVVLILAAFVGAGMAVWLIRDPNG